LRDTKASISGLPILIAVTATAFWLAMPGILRAEDPIAETTASSPSDSTSDANSTPDVSSADRKLIELNKVLIIPQKCTANDGSMSCDPNEAPPADTNPSSDSNATTDDGANSNSNPSADEDSPDNDKNSVDADSPATPDDDDNGGAVANASPAATPSPSEPDISNPDTPLPDATAQGNPAVASNDPNAIPPEYGSLEDYQSQQDAVMAVPVPVPMYPGTVYGAGTVPYPTYVNPTYANPVGGAYAAARVYTPTFRPAVGPAGPWMTPPSAMMARPGLAAAPMARPAGRGFGFHR
jgi:hypothetical protein